jgi:multisubunit Na+/H+ antiporter MnhC subunit
MPAESVLVLGAITLAFAVFAVVLMWADLHTRQTSR